MNGREHADRHGPYALQDVVVTYGRDERGRVVVTACELCDLAREEHDVR